MKRTSRQKLLTVTGYILFFLTVAVTVTVALTIFMLVNRRSAGNASVLAITMLLIIFAFSGLFTVIDLIRRKIMVNRPVSKILDATERIAAGDFSVRLYATHTYEKYDEYDLIMENLNIMVAELEKSEILKTDFVSNVSHELKTPLAIIQNYVSLLQNPRLDDDTRQKYAKTVADATKRLSDLVTNILRLNKLQNQQLPPEIARFRLDEALAEAILGFEELIEQKELSLVCDLDEISILSSQSYLDIVWNNLISNAIKFTDRGGTITVTLKREGNSAVVRVSDTGCGISPSTGARIFDKFYQGDTSHAGEGNGLGLALVKQVIDVLGGEISVSSELHVGSTFTIVLKDAR